MFDSKSLRARFRTLQTQIAKAEADAAPHIAARDVLARKHQVELDQANAKVRKATEGIFEMKQEHANIVRALNGKTAEPVIEAEG